MIILKSRIMKKFLVIALALLFCGVVTAQENKAHKELKSYLVLNAGPSFPVGDFASTNEDNDNAGFAKTGFNLDVAYGYKFTSAVGLEISGVYTNHGLSKKATDLTGDLLDHFQMVAFMPGIYVGGKIEKNTDIGCRLRGGYATVNSPRFVYEGSVEITEDWADAFVWGGGVSMKMDVSRNIFISINLDYLQGRPEFKVTNNLNQETIKAVQHIAHLDLNAGLGVRF